ncbi:MAG: hypothetical protein WC349_03830 [Patescibacteria group bacterium]|jgi:hypothetical protein
MKTIKFCTTLNEHIALEHPEALKSLRLWYLLKIHCRTHNIKDGKIFIKNINYYKSKKGLEKTLNNNLFWTYRPNKYLRFPERYLIIKSFKRIIRENGLDLENAKILYFRIDDIRYLGNLPLFKAFITKSVAELPIRKKNKRDKVGRAFTAISKKTGSSARTVIRHLKKAGVQRDLQSDFVFKYDSSDYAIYNSIEEANQNYLNIKNYDTIHNKIFKEKQLRGKWAIKMQLPNFYHFTGKQQFYFKNPIHQPWGRSVQAGKQEHAPGISKPTGGLNL